MRIRIQIQAFDDQKVKKYTAEKKYYFLDQTMKFLLIPSPP
jgi:hypothetical protein